jgi:hypothetical protein
MNLITHFLTIPVPMWVFASVCVLLLALYLIMGWVEDEALYIIEDLEREITRLKKERIG